MGGEIYLVNRDGTLLTEVLDSRLQAESIDTDMFKDCFKDYRNYYFERAGDEAEEVLASGEYKGYDGDDIFGAHQYILESNWCVMVEVGRSEFYDFIWDGFDVGDFERGFVWVYFTFVSILLLVFWVLMFGGFKR